MRPLSFPLLLQRDRKDALRSGGTIPHNVPGRLTPETRTATTATCIPLRSPPPQWRYWRMFRCPCGAVSGPSRGRPALVEFSLRWVTSCVTTLASLKGRTSAAVGIHPLPSDNYEVVTGTPMKIMAYPFWHAGLIPSLIWWAWKTKDVSPNAAACFGFRCVFLNKFSPRLKSS